MTTDREQLEAAANAAGYKWQWFGEHFHVQSSLDERLWVPWNPRTDDGDALRLAVQLGMLFTYMPDAFYAFQRMYREELDADQKPSSATRRAIVRVAAMMKEQT